VDYVDICEELAASYGLWPLEVFNMPWVFVKEFWASCMKRKRRALKTEGALRGVPIGETSPSGAPDAGPSDRELAALVGRGWGSVQFVDKIGE